MNLIRLFGLVYLGFLLGSLKSHWQDFSLLFGHKKALFQNLVSIVWGKKCLRIACFLYNFIKDAFKKIKPNANCCKVKKKNKNEIKEKAKSSRKGEK